MKDCIDRQAAIDAADRADYTGLTVEDVKKVTDEVVKELKQLPSAQPELCEDAVSRKKMFDTVAEYEKQLCEILGDENELVETVKILKHRLIALPSVQPDIKPISYQDCADAMMMMWMDNVLTDAEYRRIMDKLNDHKSRKENR